LPSVVIIDLSPAERELLAKEFIAPVMRRELLMMPYKGRRLDLATRVSNFGRLAGCPSHVWIGPNSRMRADDLKSLRREFRPITVNRLRTYAELPPYLRNIFPPPSQAAALAARLRQLDSGTPLIFVYEERESGLVGVCKVALQVDAPGLIRDFPVGGGTLRGVWRPRLREILPGAGGLIYAPGKSLGLLNFPELSIREVPLWQGDDVLGALGTLYRTLVLADSAKAAQQSSSAAESA
jgi:hypothetical protein